MKYEPPMDCVVVERELVTESEGGIKLKPPYDAKWYGRIIAVGPGMLRTMHTPEETDRYPMQYKVGDLVICPPGMNPFPDEVPIPRNSNTRLFVCSERLLIAKITFEDGDEQPACCNGKCNGKAK